MSGVISDVYQGVTQLVYNHFAQTVVLYSGDKPAKDPIKVKHLMSRSGFQAASVEMVGMTTTIRFFRPTSVEVFREELAW